MQPEFLRRWEYEVYFHMNKLHVDVGLSVSEEEVVRLLDEKHSFREWKHYSLKRGRKIKAVNSHRK